MSSKLEEIEGAYPNADRPFSFALSRFYTRRFRSVANPGPSASKVPDIGYFALVQAGGEFGLALKRQKERLPHGMFLPWIEAEFGMKARTAQLLMQRSESWSKYANLAHLPDLTPAAVIDALSDPGLPQEIRENVEELRPKLVRTLSV